MKKRQLKGIACWQNVTKEIFTTEIAPLNEPAILKGFVNHWPAVQQAKISIEKLYSYLTELYIGGDVRFARIPAKEKGRLFYNETMTDFNFKREVGPLATFLNEVLANSTQAEAETLALQSAPMKDYFPNFENENKFSLFPEQISPRVWIGNNAVVSAHYDDSENIACVVSGKRTFTLFPPKQIENLYVGPMEFTPAGAPMSLVDFEQPDFEKYPKFNEALNHALQGELEPGDAIYIPTLWWHHVKATGGVNMLVNYWAGGSISGKEKPVPADNLLMAMLSIRELPQAQKEAWKALFDHYIFSEQSDKYEHIPKKIRGVLDPLNEATKKSLKKWLIGQLK